METTNYRIQILTLASSIFACALTSTSASPPRVASYHWPQSLNDTQIIQYVLGVNKVEMQAANATKGRLSSATWQLAQRMSVDHAALDQNFRSLTPSTPEGRGEPIEPVDPDSLRDTAKLRVLDGDYLAKAYVNDEVTFHQAVLAALDQKLMPNAKSEELKARLRELRADAAAHLEHAKQVQQMISELSKPIETLP